MTAEGEAGGKETAEAGAGQCDYWQSVFAAQSDLTAQMGIGWPQQIKRNLEATRMRLRRERERREAHELGMAFAEGWGAQVEALFLHHVFLSSPCISSPWCSAPAAAPRH